MATLKKQQNIMLGNHFEILLHSLQKCQNLEMQQNLIFGNHCAHQWSLFSGEFLLCLHNTILVADRIFVK